jgi:acetyl esterase/lipase
MPSLIARLIKLGSRARIKRRPTSGPALVKHLRATLNSPAFPLRLPKNVTLSRFAGVDVHGESLSTANPNMAVLYLHGGGFIAGHPRVYRNLAAQLATKLDAHVVVPDYRLAPEHPFPAAIDDALAAYAYLRGHGYAAHEISVAGDSAGGGLALALLLALRDRGEPMPRCGVAFSPFADHSLEAASISANDASCDMFTRDLILAGRGIYVRLDQRREPYASPVFADFTGLPPLLITVSEQECLRDDSYGVLARAREANVSAELVSRQDMPHVWPIFVPYMPEAMADLARVVTFIRRHAP